jgi:hypothetical protein
LGGEIVPQAARLQPIEEFYAEDERRKTHGSIQFGFNWKDSSVSDRNCYCEVHWFYGTHEIVAIYQTVDADETRQRLTQGAVSRVALDGLAQVAGPAGGDTLQAAALGGLLAARDRATVRTDVRVLGVLEHPLERYWVLRDAFELELKPDGLVTLQRRIDECARGDRVAVTDHSLHSLLYPTRGEPSPA